MQPERKTEERSKVLVILMVLFALAAAVLVLYRIAARLP